MKKIGTQYLLKLKSTMKHLITAYLVRMAAHYHKFSIYWPSPPLPLPLIDQLDTNPPPPPQVTHLLDTRPPPASAAIWCITSQLSVTCCSISTPNVVGDHCGVSVMRNTSCVYKM